MLCLRGGTSGEDSARWPQALSAPCWARCASCPICACCERGAGCCQLPGTVAAALRCRRSMLAAMPFTSRMPCLTWMHCTLRQVQLYSVGCHGSSLCGVIPQCPVRPEAALPLHACAPARMRTPHTLAHAHPRASPHRYFKDGAGGQLTGSMAGLAEFVAFMRERPDVKLNPLEAPAGNPFLPKRASWDTVGHQD